MKPFLSEKLRKRPRSFLVRCGGTWLALFACGQRRATAVEDSEGDENSAETEPLGHGGGGCVATDEPGGCAVAAAPAAEEGETYRCTRRPVGSISPVHL